MNFRKAISLFISLILILGQTSFAFGENSVAVSSKQAQASLVLAYHKPNVTIIYNDRELGFTDVKGAYVYPIIYGGTTYIPIRGVSNLMGENIEWEPKNQIVFIGKTISQPFKGAMEKEEPKLKDPSPLASRPDQSIITVYLKPDVKIMYDFELQTFKDANDKIVYPLIYGGTTYLPVRAIAGLMGVSIEWDSNSQTIVIEREIKEEPVKKSQASVEMADLFNQSVDLYNQSTAKISILQSAKDHVTLEKMAKGVSADYQLARMNTSMGKAFKTTSYTDQEKLAYDKLMAFLELAEYYTLVLESISYMALDGQDYSIYGDTFFTFAMESASKMEEARLAIMAL